MNPFVFACVTPHGTEIIEELSQHHPGLMSATRDSMQKLRTFMVDAMPETILVLTPHGVRIDGLFAVADCERMYGEVDDNGSIVTMERVVDRELAKTIVAEAKQDGLPVGAVNFAVAAGPLSCLPLDWGAIVPLHFMPDVPIVVVTPTRSVGFAEHVQLGKAMARAVAASGKRVGLIASCDWAHAHDEEGPYGFDPAAAELDRQVVALLKENRIEAMMGFAPEFIEAAKPDGIWQALVLAGGIAQEDRDVEFLSYEVPTYFGLICAAYHRR
jgi:aromatic ring-opening dioxygenase LigB subunit